jgi:hypothetical protein
MGTIQYHQLLGGWGAAAREDDFCGPWWSASGVPRSSLRVDLIMPPVWWTHRAEDNFPQGVFHGTQTSKDVHRDQARTSLFESMETF